MENPRTARRTAAILATAIALVWGLSGVVAMPGDPAPEPVGPAPVAAPEQPLESGSVAVEPGPPGGALEPEPGARGYFVEPKKEERSEILVRGRCVAAEGGFDLGCTVRVRQGAAWVTARSSGSFAVLFTLDRDRPADPLEVRVQAEGRVPMVGRVAVPGGGFSHSGGRAGVAFAMVELGTLQLRSGARVRGTLRDAGGRPVAEAVVRLLGATPVHSGPLKEPRPAPATTNDDGGFVLPTRLGAGPYRVEVRGAPPLLPPTVVLVEPRQPEIFVELTCVDSKSADEIRGVSLDGSGRIAPGVSVQAFVGGVPVAQHRSRSDGSFVLFRPARVAGDAPVELAVSCLRRRQQSDDRIPSRWGARNVTLSLSPGHRLRVEVWAAGDGDPIGAFAVQCLPLTGPRSSQDGRLVADGEHPDGTAWVEGLRAGPHLVVIRPRGAWSAGFRSSLPQRVLLPVRGVGTARVELHKETPLTVRVEDGEGRPVVGSTVSLLTLHGCDELTGRTVVTDLRDVFRNGGTRGPVAIQVARARTDADGVARLGFYPSPQELTLQVRGEHPTRRLGGVVFESAGQVERVVVTRGASLSGRLFPGRLLSRVHAATRGQRERFEFLRKHEGKAQADRFRRLFAGGLVLIEKGGAGRRLPFRTLERILVDDAGRFRVAAIPAGTWHVYLHRLGGRGVFEDLGKPLATVVLRAGEERKIDFDLRGLIEGTALTGEVRLNDQPLRQARVQLAYVGRDGVRRVAAETFTDVRGSFQVKGLSPRVYELCAVLDGERIPLAARLELRAAGRRSGSFVVATGAVRVRVGGDRSGRRIVSLRGPDGARTVRRRVGPRGEARFRYLLVGSYRIVGVDAPPFVVRQGREQVVTIDQ